MRRGDFEVEKNKRIRFIAELSGNHCGDLKLARSMIKKAKESGATFVKLQYYKTEMLYGREHPLFEKVKEAELNIKQITELKGFAEKEAEIPLVCTVFVAPKLVDDLEEIGLNYYKIRCLDSQNLKLIDRVLETGKPVFISTTRLPINSHYLYHPSIKWLYTNPHYPPELSEFELNRVAVFDGFSCHFPNITVPLAAAVMAKAENKKEYYIETHVTLSHEMEVIDSKVSIDFSQLKKLIEQVRLIEQFGGKNYSVPP